MFLVSDTNLTLAFAIAAGVAALLAIAALVLYGRAAAGRSSLASRLNQLERGADHTERRMFQILNSIPVALVETDTSGRFVFANKAAHALLGRKDAELIGLRFHSATWGITYPDGKLIPPDLLPAARALRGQTVRGFPHLIINPNTRKRILVSVTAMPVTNDLGEVIGSTAAMVETDGLVEQVVDAPAAASPWSELTGEVLLALDPDGKVLEISRGGARLLGRERGEIEARDWFEFLPEDDRAQARAQFQTLVEGGVEPGVEGEGSLAAADGSVRRLAWRTDVLRDDEGKVRAVLAAGREVVEAPPAPEPEPQAAPAPIEDPRFASLAEAAEEAVWTADAESGRLTYVSPAFTRLYGFTLQDLEADVSPWMAKVDAEDRPAVQAAWEAAIAGQTREVEFRWSRSEDVTAQLIRDRLFPIRDGEGRVVGVGGAARDVSDRAGAQTELQAARAELDGARAELHEAQALVRGLFATPGVQVGVLESLGDDFRFTAASTAVDGLFGRPVAGATGRDLGLTSEEIAGWTAAIDGAESRGETTLIEQPIQIGGRDAGWRLAAYAPLPRSPEGRARATFVAVDISDRHKSEAALRESEARARALAEAAPQLVWSTTPSGWCDYVSPRWIEYTGVPAERHYGLGWQEAIHPEDRALAAAAWNAAVDGGGDYDVDYRLRAADGSYRWFRARSAAQRDEAGQIARWFGVSTDVTELVEAKAELERRAAEQNAEFERRAEEQSAELERALDDHRKTEAALAQAQRLETVGRLTGGVAHDFNNLLTVMIGALDIIQRHADKADRVRRLSEAALTAGRRGERLTRQLLAFSRRQEFEPQHVDLARLIHGFEPLVRRALGEGTPFVLEVPDDLGGVRIDPVQFEASLLNLIVNAKDAVETGGSVTLRADRVRLQAGELADLAEGDYLRVAVVDTGVGMTAEVAARALEPFFTTKEAGKGTGLGLAQVYGFARQSGGQVQIDSAPGAGAAVSVYLPAEEARATEPTPDDADEPETEPEVAELLVEDETDALQVARS
jgi:PAS domain S-box-containing protein